MATKVKKGSKKFDKNVRLGMETLEHCSFDLSKFKSISEIKGVVKYLKTKYGKFARVSLDIEVNKVIELPNYNP